MNKTVTKTLSECCKAKTRVNAAIDFAGGRDACHMCNVCTKCKKPCKTVEADFLPDFSGILNSPPKRPKETEIPQIERLFITNLSIELKKAEKPDVHMEPFNITCEYRIGELRGFNKGVTEALRIVFESSKKYKIEKLEEILKNQSGGGGWRRIITSKIEELKNE